MARKARKKVARSKRRRSATSALAPITRDAQYEADRKSDHNKSLIQESVRRAEWNLKHRGGNDHDLEVLTVGEYNVAAAHRVGMTAQEIRAASYLPPIALVEDPQWPDGTGIRKELNSEMWSAIIDEGAFCFRCRHRQAVPFQFRCDSCGWTIDLTAKAIDALYARGLAGRARTKQNARMLRRFAERMAH